MTSHSAMSQSRQNTPGVKGNQQFAVGLQPEALIFRSAGGRPQNAQSDVSQADLLAREPEALIDHREAQDNPDTFLPGVHPKFGRGQWGLEYSEQESAFQVNHGFYGAFGNMQGTVMVSDEGERIPVDPTDVLWTSDHGAGEDAALIWNHRDQISAALLSIGYGGTKKVRVRAQVGPDSIVVSNYDYPDRFDPLRIPRAR